MQSQTKHTNRRWVILCMLAGLLALALFYGVSSSHSRYRSWARISVTPFTNAVLQEAFLEQTFRAMKGVQVNLHEGNGLIRITADASTAESARSFAEDATRAYRTAVKKAYGVSAEVIDHAEKPLRPYSLFRDDVWPGIKRFLKRVGLQI
jgi:hypothetical protein